MPADKLDRPPDPWCGALDPAQGVPDLRPEHTTGQPSSKPQVGGREEGEGRGREKGKGAMGWLFWAP